MPHSDDNPYPIGHLSAPARRSWSVYSEVVPEPEWPELYAAILALNGWLVSGAQAVGGEKDRQKPGLQMQRFKDTWLSAKKDLRLAERLSGKRKRSGLDKLRAM